MKISVLMPICYKEKVQYVEESLKSLLNQTLMPNQIVIIEDGKLTQGLYELLEKYKKMYPNLIETYATENNIGSGLATRYGVQKCRNEYIARMDSDDIALPDRFEKQVRVLEENRNVDLLGGYIAEYDEKMEKMITLRKVPLEMPEIKKYIKSQCPTNHMTIIIKKEALIKCGNYRDMKMEDYDVCIRMLKNGYTIKNIDEVLCNVRTGKPMYKRRSGVKQIRNVIKIEKELLEYKIINKFEFIYNIIIRSIFAMIPANLKKIIYVNIIRKASINIKIKK